MLTGGAGTDIIDGAGGADIIAAGAGNDSVTYRGTEASIDGGASANVAPGSACASDRAISSAYDVSATPKSFCLSW